MFFQKNRENQYRAGEMDFKVEGPWNTGKFGWPLWLADKIFFLNSRPSRMAKKVTF